MHLSISKDGSAQRPDQHTQSVFLRWTLAIDNGHCGARAPPARLPRERNPGPVAAACPPPRIHVHITPSPIAIQRFTANLYNIHRAWATSPHICFVANAQHHNHGPWTMVFRVRAKGVHTLAHAQVPHCGMTLVQTVASTTARFRPLGITVCVSRGRQQVQQQH